MFGAWPHQRPLAAGANERNHLADHRIVGKFARHGFDPVSDAAFDEEQGLVGATDTMHLRLGGATPPQADDIQANQRPGLAKRKTERNDIVAGRRHARHHHAFADANELMDSDVTAEESEIADFDMTAEDRVV